MRTHAKPQELTHDALDASDSLDMPITPPRLALRVQVPYNSHSIYASRENEAARGIVSRYAGIGVQGGLDGRWVGGSEEVWSARLASTTFRGRRLSLLTCYRLIHVCAAKLGFQW